MNEKRLFWLMEKDGNGTWKKRLKKCDDIFEGISCEKKVCLERWFLFLRRVSKVKLEGSFSKVRL